MKQTAHPNITVAFRLLLEEIEGEIAQVNQTGSRAFAEGLYEVVEATHQSALRLIGFHDQVKLLFQQWEETGKTFDVELEDSSPEQQTKTVQDSARVTDDLTVVKEADHPVILPIPEQTETAVLPDPQPYTLHADDIYAALYPDRVDNPSYHDIRIEAMELPPRGYNALLRARITTVGQLEKLSEAQLLAIPGMGQRSVQDVYQEVVRFTGNLTARILTERPLADLSHLAELAHVSLSVLQLPSWVQSKFVSGQITTVGQLAALTDSQMEKLGRAKGLGEQRLAEVKAAFSAYVQEQTTKALVVANITSPLHVAQEGGNEGESSVVYADEPWEWTNESTPEPGAVEKTAGSDTTFLPDEMAQQEENLLLELTKVRLIGELALSEAAFRDMCSMIQNRVTRGEQTPLPEEIPPAWFVVTMVFTARFSRVDGRNFWIPYAQWVWGLPEASQAFQNECRQYFAASVQKLETFLPNLLPFVQTTDGDLVRPVYRHAVLPGYLENDFISWLQKEWPNILDIPASDLAEALREDRRVQTQPRPLVAFLQEKETAETAVALITELANGIRRCLTGNAPETVANQWFPDSIPYNLWQRVSASLTDSMNSTSFERQGSGKLEWIWDLSENELFLRLRNLTLRQRPESVVWHEANLREYVNPWQTDTGRWWIDEMIFTDLQVSTGKLLILDEEESVLTQLVVPSLPNQPWLLFQASSDNQTAVLDDGNKNGWFCLSAQNDVSLQALQGKVHLQETLPVPTLLKILLGHEEAGWYYLDLPVTVWQGNTLLKELERNEESVKTSPVVKGLKAIEGTSPHLPPVFQDTQIQLTIPEATSDLIQQTTLWLRGGVYTFKLPLRELTFTEQGKGITINLQPFLPSTPGTYNLQLRQGLRPLLQEPVSFAVLPEIRITSPVISKLYSPSFLPGCTLYGLTVDNIIPNTHYSVEERANGAIYVSWTNLRHDNCLLTLQFDQETVQLGWDLPNRIFSWLASGASHNFVRESDLSQNTIQIIAPPEQKYRYFQAWIEGYPNEIRKIPFRRRRLLSRASIQPGDAIHEMIRDHIRLHPGRLVRVQASLYDCTWTLLEIHLHPQIDQAQIQYLPGQQALQFTCHLSSPWEGSIVFSLHDLHHPFEPPRTWELDRLESTHLLPFTVSSANHDYLLTIHCNGQVLPLPHELRLTEGTATQYDVPDIPKLLGYLHGQTKGVVSGKYGSDLVRLLNQQIITNPSFSPTAQHLYLMATLKVEDYSTVTNNELNRLWFGLRRLRQIHDVSTWRNQYGLLPSWAVLDQPVRLQLARHPKVVLRVFPEKISEKGKHGVGYAYLNLENNRKEKVYVSWEPAHGHYVRVLVGWPSKNEVPYAEMDEQDLRPIRQCSQCGFFVGSDGPLARKHHGRCIEYYNARFTTPTYDRDLIAELRTEETILQHQYQPSMYIDQQNTLSAWSRDSFPSMSYNGNPILVDAYDYATLQWIRRYKNSIQHRETMEQLIHNRQRSLDSLAQRLEEFDIPAFQATARFLTAIHSSKPPLRLDQTVILLALLLRAHADNIRQANILLSEIRLTQTSLETMLASAHNICPELLLWAITWIELFYVHARS